MAPRLGKQVRSNWTHHLLICAKCSKKIGGGFGRGGDQRLAKALRNELGLKKGRKAAVGIAEVKCLGVCPKKAVTVIDSADSRAWHIIPTGTAIADVIETLGLDDGSNDQA